MAAKPGPKKKSGSTHRSAGAGEKDRLISELKDRVATLEKELRSKQRNGNSEDSVERKRAEEALCESESRFRQLSESLPQLVWTCRADGPCDYLSPQWVSYTGIPEDAQLGYGWLDQVHPDDRERVSQEWASAAAHGEVFDIEFRIRRYDGAYRWFKTRAIPLKDKAGTLVKWFGSNTDINGLKRTEEALRESEDRLRLAQVAANVGVWDWFPKTGVEVFSPEMNRLYGLPPDTVKTYEDWLSRVHPDDVDRMKSERDAAMARHEPFDLAFRVFHGSGEIRWMNAKGSAIYDEKGEIKRVLGINVDITGRKRADDSLKESKERLAADLAAMTRLQKLSTSFVQEGNFDSLLDDIMGTAVEISGSDKGTLQLIRPGSDHLDIVAQRGFEQYFIDFFSSASHGTAAVCATAFDRGERVIVEDVEESPIFVGTPALDVQRRAGVRAVQSTPIVNRRGVMIGMLSTHWCKPGRPADNILRYMDLLAGQAADIIERKQSEETLQESKARLEAVFSSMNDGVIIFGADGKATSANEAAARFHRFTDKEDFFMSLGGYAETFDTRNLDGTPLDPHDWPAARALRGEVVYNQEVVVMRRETGESWIGNYSAAPIRDEQGNVVAAVLTMRDVTESKHAEEALRESEIRFRGINEQAPLGIALIDSTSGRFLQVNRRYGEIVGLAPGEMLATDFQSITHPDDLQADLDNMVRLLRGEIPSFRMDKRYVHPDGSIAWVSLTAVPMWDAKSPRKYHIAMVEDITERKRAEEALHNSKEEFQALADNIPNLAWMANADGWIFWYNKQWYDYTGTTLEEMLGWGWQKVHHPDYVKAVTEEWSTRIREGKPYDNIFPLRGRDGSYRWFLTRVTPIKDEEGIIQRWFGTNTDITERKRAEEALAESKQQAELYLDLMGHDISNMHQIILGQLQLADEIMDLEGKLDAGGKELIDVSIRNLLRSAKLIANVKNLQKLRAGEFSLEPVDLDEVLNDAVMAYSHIPDKHVTIEYDRAHGHVVMVNPVIKEVFNNLIDNAVKHSGDPVRIGIAISHVNMGGRGYHMVAIEDNGPGIPDEKKEEVFDRLKRGQTKARGTGLGLYLVKMLVDSFGGIVKLEDRVMGDYTQGCRFLVLLPVVEEAGNGK